MFNLNKYNFNHKYINAIYNSRYKYLAIDSQFKI